MILIFSILSMVMAGVCLIFCKRLLDQITREYALTRRSNEDLQQSLRSVMEKLPDPAPTVTMHYQKPIFNFEEHT